MSEGNLILIEENEFLRCDVPGAYYLGTGIFTPGGAGVLINDKSSFNTIAGNYFHDNHQHLIIASGSLSPTLGTCGQVISENIFKNVGRNSIQYTNKTTNAARVPDIIAGNTIFHDPNGWARSGGLANTDAGHGIGIQGTGSPVSRTRVIGNTIYCGTVGSGASSNIQALCYNNMDLVETGGNRIMLANGAKAGKLGVTDYVTVDEFNTALAAVDVSTALYSSALSFNAYLAAQEIANSDAGTIVRLGAEIDLNNPTAQPYPALTNDMRQLSGSLSGAPVLQIAPGIVLPL